MFVYEKKLQYPVKIANTNPKLAGIVISQYGGPDTVEQQKDSFRAVVIKKRRLLLQPPPDLKGCGISPYLTCASSEGRRGQRRRQQRRRP